MSFYATIAGAITYPEPADFEAALRLLQMDGDGWVDEAGFFVDEMGARLTEERPNIDRTHRIINFPQATFRNLARFLQELFAGGTGRLIWSSTDGCFEGGVINDGRETNYDLEAWDRAKTGEAAPDADADFDEHVQWQEQVQEAFFKQFGG